MDEIHRTLERNQSGGKQKDGIDDGLEMSNTTDENIEYEI